VAVELNFEHQGVKGEGVLYAKAPNAAAQEVTVTALGKKLGAFHDYFDGAQGGEEATFYPSSRRRARSWRTRASPRTSTRRSTGSVSSRRPR
jgi:hypothetical protein